jgi:hypothetical protein
MKNPIIKKTVILLLPVAMLALASCSSTKEKDGQPSEMRGGVVLDAVTGSATVTAVNAGERTVTLQRADGSSETVECGPDVRNFDQIKVGDQVTATATEEVAIVLVKGGMPPAAGTATAIVRSPAGAKPGGQIVHTIGFVAKVVSVDVDKRDVSLQLPDGTIKIVKVGADIDLKNVNAGDDVGVQLTRAFAISVTTPEK